MFKINIKIMFKKIRKLLIPVTILSFCFLAFWFMKFQTTTDQAQAATGSSITQYGITWQFDKDYTYGTFANGDYWVLGPVVITNITPAFNGYHNGWQVNPTRRDKQGYEYGSYSAYNTPGSFDASLVPSLPYTAQAGSSIVKAVSVHQDPTWLQDCYGVGCLQTVAVLTVVGEIPPDNGATVFRPPYVGSQKPYYSINDINTSLIPAVAPVANAPTLATVYNYFKMMQMDYIGGRTGRLLRPIDNMGTDDHGCAVGRRSGDAVLRLLFNDSLELKKPLLYALVQYGIDLNYSIKNGQTWEAGGGHESGRKIVLALTATLLNNADMKNTLAGGNFEENNGIYLSEKTGNVLYGFEFEDTDCSEQSYWNRLVNEGGNKACKDPYDYIEGGWFYYNPELMASNYEYCVYQPLKAAVTTMKLMPSLRTTWNNELAFDYMDRFTNIGYWASNDPCAPHDGIWANYGKTYGPDGNGGCILDTNPADGVGRFPGLHNTHADAVGIVHQIYAFPKAMWNAYRGAQCYNNVCEAGETVSNCAYDCDADTTPPSAPSGVSVN